MDIRLPSVPRYSKNCKLMLAGVAVASMGFLGVYHLVRVLYLLRLGHGPDYVGIFIGSGALTYSAMGVPAGALSQKLGTRKVMLLGLAIVMGGLLMLTAGEVMPGALRVIWPILSHMVATAGWCLVNVNSVPALMAVTTPENRNGAYAVLSAMRSLGGLVGSLVGGWLPGLFVSLTGHGFDAPLPYRATLWVGAALMLIGFVPFLAMRGAEMAPAQKQDVEHEGRFPYGLVVPFALYVCLSHGGWAASNAFANAYLDQILHMSPAAIGQLTSIGQAAAILMPLVMPKLIKRWSAGWVMIVSTLGIAAGFLCWGVIDHWFPASVGRIVIYALAAIRMPATQVHMMDLVEKQWRSLSYGVYSMGQSLGSGLMSILGGFVVAAAGYHAIFTLAAGLCTFSAAWLGGVLRHGAHRESRTSPSA